MTRFAAPFRVIRRAFGSFHQNKGMGGECMKKLGQSCRPGGVEAICAGRKQEAMHGFGCAVSLWISGPVRNSQVGGKGSGPVQQNGVFRRFFMRVTLTTVSDWISKPQDLHPHCCVIPRGMHRKNLREFVRFDHENESNATRNSYAPDLTDLEPCPAGLRHKTQHRP